MKFLNKLQKGREIVHKLAIYLCGIYMLSVDLLSAHYTAPEFLVYNS